jgi:hypothetical protein
LFFDHDNKVANTVACAGLKKLQHGTLTSKAFLHILEEAYDDTTYARTRFYYMSELKIHKSRWKAIKPMVIASPFVFGSLYFLDHSEVPRWLSWMSILFFRVGISDCDISAA